MTAPKPLPPVPAEEESDSDRRWKRDHEDKGQDWSALPEVQLAEA